jgi:WD40 repeat protein
VASGSDDKKIKIWDIRSKRLIQHYDAHASSVSSISFHPSGNYLLSSGLDGLVKIWDLKLGQIIYTLHGHEGPATATGFSNCGDFFATGGTDSIVMIWQSNISSMSEEFDKLNKSEISNMKSNRKFVNESNSKLENLEKFKVSNYSKHSKSSSKFTVVKPDPNEKNKLKSNDESKIPNPNSQTNQLNNVNNVNQVNSNSDNAFSKLPGELASTFEKMISQMDLISK